MVAETRNWIGAGCTGKCIHEDVKPDSRTSEDADEETR